MELITSRNSKIIKDIIAIKKSRKKSGKFFLEGKGSISELANTDIPVELLLVTSDAIKKNNVEINSIISRADKVFCITDDVMAKISDNKSPQGIFALCDEKFLNNKMLDTTKDKKVIILENLQDPGNLGTIIRTAAAMDISRVILVNCADYLSAKVIRSTAGQLFRGRITVSDDITAVVSELKSNGFTVYATDVGSTALSVTDVDFSKSCAIIIGNEGAGVSIAAKAIANSSIYIPMAEGVESLNAGVATSIIMWEMQKKD